MGETTCKTCGGIKNPDQDCSPTLWCNCAPFPSESPSDEDIDPSEIDDYYREMPDDFYSDGPTFPEQSTELTIRTKK